MKAQWVRLVDVILVGPVMVAAARRLRPTSPGLAGVLEVLGYLTVAYNGANYLRLEARR